METSYSKKKCHKRNNNSRKRGHKEQRIRKGRIKKRREQELGRSGKCEEWYRVGGRVRGFEGEEGFEGGGGFVEEGLEGRVVGTGDTTVPLLAGGIESDFGI